MLISQLMIGQAQTRRGRSERENYRFIVLAVLGLVFLFLDAVLDGLELVFCAGHIVIYRAGCIPGNRNIHAFEQTPWRW